MTFGSPEDAKETIKKWLSSSEHSVREVKAKDSAFDFEIDYPIGQQMKQHIIQPDKVADLIVIVNSIAISPEHLNGLSKMKPAERQSMIHEMGKELVLRDNQYEFQFSPEGVLSSVVFTYPIFFDGLTKDNLYRALDCNFKSFVFLSMVLTEQMGHAPASSHDASRMYG